MRDRWREYRYRKIHSGLTHEQYLDEPCETVDWDLAFEHLEGEMEEEAVKKAQAQQRSGR